MVGRRGAEGSGHGNGIANYATPRGPPQRPAAATAPLLAVAVADADLENVGSGNGNTAKEGFVAPEEVRFWVSLRGHEGYSEHLKADLKKETLREFGVAVERHARSVGFIDPSESIQRWLLAFGKGSEPAHLDADCTIGYAINSGVTHLLAGFNSSSRLPTWNNGSTTPPVRTVSVAAPPDLAASSATPKFPTHQSSSWAAVTKSPRASSPIKMQGVAGVTGNGSPHVAVVVDDGLGLQSSVFAPMSRFPMLAIQSVKREHGSIAEEGHIPLHFEVTTMGRASGGNQTSHRNSKEKSPSSFEMAPTTMHKSKKRMGGEVHTGQRRWRWLITNEGRWQRKTSALQHLNWC